MATETTLDAHAIAEQTKQSVSALCAEATAMMVDSPEADIAAARLLNKVDAEAKRVDAALATVTRPMKEAMAAAKALFLPIHHSLELASTLLRQRIGAFKVAAEEANRKQRAAEEAERREADRIENERHKQAAALIEQGVQPAVAVTLIDAPAAPVIVQAPIPKLARADDGSGTTLAWTPDFEIVNPSLVPDRFLKVDEVAIGKAVRSGGVIENQDGTRTHGCAAIPGVRIFLKSGVRRT